MSTRICSASGAILMCLVVFGCGLAADQKANNTEKKTKEAKRMVCVVLELRQSYKLAAEPGEIIKSCFVPDADAVAVAAGTKPTEVVLTPKKVGVHQIVLTGAKGMETLNVVILPAPANP